MMPSPTRITDLSPSLRCVHHHVPYPIPSELGTWLTQQRAFARGSDFTSVGRSPMQAGRSMLQRLWSGGAREEEKDLYHQAHVWSMMRGEECIAVVLWEVAKPDHPRNQYHGQHCAGRVSLWTHPKYRRQAMIQNVLEEALPQVTKTLDATKQWYMRGADATFLIVPKYWAIAMTDGLTPKEDKNLDRTTFCPTKHKTSRL